MGFAKLSDVDATLQGRACKKKKAYLVNMCRTSIGVVVACMLMLLYIYIHTYMYIHTYLVRT